MKKVRPTVDKDLRDEIVNYCGGGESFNSALRYYVKGKARAENFAHIGRVRLINLERDNKALKKYIAKLDNDNADLNGRLLNKERENSQQKHDIAELMKGVVVTNKDRTGLNASIKDVEDNCIKIFNQVAPTMEVIAGLMMGIGIGLLVGVFFL